MKIIFLSFFFFVTSILYEDGDYWFPFPTVSMNFSEKCSIDMSYLNWKIEEKVQIKDGHFYYKNKRVKFFGTNAAFTTAFPLKEDAPKIAKRLAQLGINIIRFHHMDNQDIWQNNSLSILSPIKLDRLHYFLFCLKQNGIYANINLHVGRNYPEMLSNSTLLSSFTFGKSVDRFYPPFINDQKNYARDLLNSYNNYTKYKIGEDPMVLNIELNNENTIYDLWGDEKFHLLNEKMQKELISQWRIFLKSKYKTFEEINKFYNGDLINKKINIIENNTIICQKDNANCTIDKANNLISFNVISSPKNSWGNQILYGAINITNSTFYTVEFDAKVKNPTKGTLFFCFQEDKSPYRYYFEIRKIELNTNFKHYSLYTTTLDDCQFSEGAKPLVKIILPGEINYFEIKNLKLYKGKENIKITEDNSKTLDKVLYPNNYLLNIIPNMAYDLRLFFKYTETNTQKSLQNYIKNDLGFKNIYILDSQLNFGTLYSTEREFELSDIIDAHCYWEHPIFQTGHSWDYDYYSIPNKPMIQSKTFGTFPYISCGKSYNKPYTITEYNHPFPNEHLHENFPMFGSWSSFHDYDAIYQYNYEQSEDEYIKGYFTMSSNPIQFSLAPYVALAFRNDYVKKGKNYIKMKLTKGYIDYKMKQSTTTLFGLFYNLFYTGWNAVFELEIDEKDNKYKEPIYESNINISDKGYFITDEIQWNNTDYKNHAYYRVDAEKYFSLTGFLGNSKMNIENNITDLISIKLKLNEKLNETCTIGLVSLDDKKLIDSQKLLLTIAGKVRNSGQIWYNNRTTTKKDGWGHAPTLVQFIQFECILKFKEEDKPKVFSINNYGELNKEYNITGSQNKWILKSDENNPTLNYYIIRNIKNNESFNYILLIGIISIIVILILGFVILFCLVKKCREKKDNKDNDFLIPNSSSVN